MVKLNHLCARQDKVQPKIRVWQTEHINTQSEGLDVTKQHKLQPNIKG